MKTTERGPGRPVEASEKPVSRTPASRPHSRNGLSQTKRAKLARVRRSLNSDGYFIGAKFAILRPDGRVYMSFPKYIRAKRANPEGSRELEKLTAAVFEMIKSF